jgi:hypothetical protein
MDSSKAGGSVAPPAHREDTRRAMGSRLSPYERRREGTLTEPRGTPAVDRSMATPPPPRGGPAATPGRERRARRARQEPQTRYTALMHHCTVDNLRAGFAALDGTKAPGVDGGTKARYAQHREANVQALHQTLPPRSSRPQPGRRGEMAQEDGPRRPLGISGTDDKSVQELPQDILERGMHRCFSTPRRASDPGAVGRRPCVG